MTDPTSPQQKVAAIADTFFNPQRLARGLLRVGVVIAVTLGSVVLARVGTGSARVSAGAIALFTLGITLWTALRERRALQKPDYWFERTLDRLDAELAGRVRRAYRLFLATPGRPLQPGASGERPSFELAQLHVGRALDQVSLKHVAHLAQLRRRRALRVAWFVLLVSGVAVLVWPLVIVEGLDVLLARRGVGPVALSYVEDLQLTAEWPAYLDGTGERKRLGSGLLGIPEGSEIEVRVVPSVTGRELLLTDGIKRVPLVSDGQGALVARWVADDPAGLKVAARFGDVLLYDVRSTRLEPLSDLAPVVRLAGAPRTLQLAEVERLELTFMASDDHGLSQVDLVLSSGQRQVRTELVRLDGQARFYRGGHALTSEHELLRRAFLPVHVRIEARDGNTATGPLWGQSQEYVLLPEPLGNAVAQRHIALRQFRRAVSAYVAREHEAGYLALAKQKDAEGLAAEALGSALGVLQQEWSKDASAPRRSLSFLVAQVEALSRAQDRATPEAVLLAVDALLHQLGQREARQLAQDLGQSVEEIAVQSRQLRFDPASLTQQGVLDLLAGNELGAKQLAEVGQLGLDLGSVALADLARISRLVKERSFDRAEAAALHLAERLKRATPSFSSSGGSAAGVESGAARGGPSGGQPGPGQPASSAPQDFEHTASEVNQLAQEGAAELSELERLLEEALQALESDFNKSPALDEALAELRQAIQGLPEMGRGAGSASSEAASARSQAEAMAEALEVSELEEGIERGRDAEQALKRARGLLEQGFGYLDEGRLERAEQAVQKAIEESKRSLAEQKTRTAQLGQGQKRERAARQRELAERARELATRGGRAEAALPTENVEHLERAATMLDDAARALEEGDGKKSVELAEGAQEHLEHASFESKDDAPEDDAGADGDELAFSGRVPGQDEDRAKEFRQRVEQGLGRGSGRLSPAVRRYAEDLK